MAVDSLFRVSFKCLIIDDNNNVLVVKERDRSSWDLPGGGMEQGETIVDSIARELHEEISFTGSFKYKILAIQDPVKLRTRDIWQIKVIVRLEPENYIFGVGQDADEIKFIDPQEFTNSHKESENRIPNYVTLATA